MTVCRAVVILALAQAADVLTTLAGLSLGATEGNPLGQTILALGGPVALLAPKALWILGAVAAFTILPRQHRAGPAIALAALRALPVVNNLAVIAGLLVG